MYISSVQVFYKIHDTTCFNNSSSASVIDGLDENHSKSFSTLSTSSSSSKSSSTGSAATEGAELRGLLTHWAAPVEQFLIHLPIQ
jgi:hypothetical protein